MSSDSGEAVAKWMQELLGGCLQAVGIIVAGLTGLCSGIILLGVNSWRSLTSALDSLAFFAVPFLVGLGMIFAGRLLIRSARRDRF